MPPWDIAGQQGEIQHLAEAGESAVVDVAVVRTFFIWAEGHPEENQRELWPGLENRLHSGNMIRTWDPSVAFPQSR
jgi:hypothetical protein